MNNIIFNRAYDPRETRETYGSLAPYVHEEEARYVKPDDMDVWYCTEHIPPPEDCKNASGPETRTLLFLADIFSHL